MFLLNPPPVPSSVAVSSADPVIAAVEWACKQADLRYEVYDQPKIAAVDRGNRVEMINVGLPDIGIYIDVENAGNSVVRQRNMEGRLVFDGDQGMIDLVAYLRRLKGATIHR